VQEILELTKITKVPQSPPYMRGVINLRGSVVPVIDTRIKFGMPQVEQTVNTCIIVLSIQMEGEKLTIGAMVDGVQEVIEVESGQVKPAPSIGSKYKSEIIEGMVKIEQSFIMLLHIDRIFSTDELVVVKEAHL
jgi:purine-binding chemotaxis protein CheW